MNKFAALFVAVLTFVPLVAAQKKIVVQGLTPSAMEEFRAVAPGVEIVAADRGRLAEQVADADAILGAVTPDVLRSAKKLKWVQIYSAGAERVLFPELRDSSIALTNAKILMGPEIADHAFALLLSLTRDLYQTIPDRGEWARGKYHPVELRGKTAVVIGCGGIGTQIAQRAFAFGMSVIGVDPKEIPYTSFITKVVPPDRLDGVLPQADVVFVSAPLTRQSEGMVGPRQFDLMKKGAYFIAVSRGKLYNTGALVRALDSQHLAGAGLDVTDPEPLPKDHPLWKFENVVITPHIAGQSDKMPDRQMDLFKENIRRFAAGEPLLNVVDKQKGY